MYSLLEDTKLNAERVNTSNTTKIHKTVIDCNNHQHTQNHQHLFLCQIHRFHDERSLVKLKFQLWFFRISNPTGYGDTILLNYQKADLQ